MSLQLEGFEGFQIGATSRNMIRALSLSLSPQAEVTLSQERTWSILDIQTPTGAGDFFFYLLNTSQRDFLITRLEASAPTAETVTLQGVTGTAVGGTSFTPINRTVGSGRQPSPTVDIQTGVDITGLTSSGSLERLNVPTTGKEIKELNDRPVLIRPNSAVALVATTGAIALNFAVDIMTQAIDPIAAL